MEWDIEKIICELNIEYKSEGMAKKICEISSITEATANALAFCYWDGEKGRSLISQSDAGVIICKKNIEGLIDPKPKHQLIFVDNPKLLFIKIANIIAVNKPLRGISSSAKISDDAKIDCDCYVGDFVFIGEKCKIGKNVIIYDRVNIRNCVINDNCVIQSGVSIGHDGFGYERDIDGTLEKFPQLKGVKIGNNVEIGSNCSIARGSLVDTVIGNGTKIDALVHLAHNVVVGNDCQITAGSIVGGSTRIGNSCWLGLNSTLKDRINIGNNVIVASGASVIRNVPDADVVAGVPAKSIKDKLNSKELFKMNGLI